MPADFQWSESNGVGEVETTPLANLNFGSIDIPELDPNTYPIGIVEGVSGGNSYYKYIRGLFTIETGLESIISNIRFWKYSGNYVTGESGKGLNNISYLTPSPEVIPGDVSIPITEETAWYLQSAEGEDTIETGVSGISGYTKYIRLQLRFTVDTLAGAVNSKTFIIQYDEM